MSLQTRTKAILLTAVVLTALLAAIVGVYFILRVRSTGTIKTVRCEIYWDQQGTQTATEIQWGILEPGKTASKVLFIKNKSNVMANLTLGVEDFDPPTAADYITLSWDYDGHKFNPDEIIAVTFYLEVSPDIRDIYEFSFYIVIIASG